MPFDTRELRWQLKHLLRWSPSLQEKRGEPRIMLLDKLDTAQRQRLAFLRERFNFDDWPRLCDDVEYRENLYLLDVLVQYVPALSTQGCGLDIGCRNFAHLPALSAFMPGAWDGIELDAHVRYWNGHTRRAYGEWMARQRPGSRYIAGDLLDHTGSYDVIVWTLPYVVEGPLKAWGLPSRFFQPLALLRHAHSLLKPDGVMLVVNQGPDEAEEQRALFDAAGIAAQALGEVTSVFSPFRFTRHGWLLRGA